MRAFVPLEFGGRRGVEAEAAAALANSCKREAVWRDRLEHWGYWRQKAIPRVCSLTPIPPMLSQSRRSASSARAGRQPALDDHEAGGIA